MRSVFQIIVADCIKWLDQYIGDGTKFDFVFGDLTDIPLSTTPQGEIWDFIRLILNKALKVLKPTGKFMTHVRKSELQCCCKFFNSTCLGITD
jgi:spermine synthase